MRTTVVAQRFPLNKPIDAPLMMTEQFSRESKYQYAMSIARNWLGKGMISRPEFVKIDTMFARKFSPVWGDI